jgi:hypothetical protein
MSIRSEAVRIEGEKPARRSEGASMSNVVVITRLTVDGAMRVMKGIMHA